MRSLSKGILLPVGQDNCSEISRLIMVMIIVRQKYSMAILSLLMEWVVSKDWPKKELEQR